MMSEIKKYIWPDKDKIKAYKRLRESGRRCVQLQQFQQRSYFRTVWQTGYGKHMAPWRLLPTLLEGPTGLVTVSEEMFQAMKKSSTGPYYCPTTIYRIISGRD